MTKNTKQIAIVNCKQYGIDFDLPFDQLSFSDLDFLHNQAIETGYKKPKNANGSLGRYFFNYLKRSINDKK